MRGGQLAASGARHVSARRSGPAVVVAALDQPGETDTVLEGVPPRALRTRPGRDDLAASREAGCHSRAGPRSVRSVVPVLSAERGLGLAAIGVGGYSPIRPRFRSPRRVTRTPCAADHVASSRAGPATAAQPSGWGELDGMDYCSRPATVAASCGLYVLPSPVVQNTNPGPASHIAARSLDPLSREALMLCEGPSRRRRAAAAVAARRARSSCCAGRRSDRASGLASVAERRRSPGQPSRLQRGCEWSPRWRRSRGRSGSWPWRA